jgi:hypothetical protein
MIKRIYTLSISDSPEGYAPELRKLTYPLLKNYAHKIGAEFFEINKRKFTAENPDLPPVYEKFQIYEIAKEYPADWHIFIDADALIHPEFPDVTAIIPKDTVMFHSKDFVPIRFRPDKYFLRDGRMIGEGNWFAVASDWCTDLWHPLDKDDITPEEAVENIFPTVLEASTVIKRNHLIDDWLVSRNIARYGLKHQLMSDFLMSKFGFNTSLFLHHEYTQTIEEKEIRMKARLQQWGIGVPG